jgi:enoyl-CoA hydratase/carnithine racemase
VDACCVKPSLPVQTIARVAAIGATRRNGTQTRSSLSGAVSGNVEPLPPQPNLRAMSMQQSARPGPFETILYEEKDAAAYVTLNRPKVMNALNQKAISELRAAYEDARDDPQIRGAIITGAGERAFIAGADIGELAKATPIEAERQTRAGQRLLTLVEHLGKPVIAAVNGPALGGGPCETALACTIRLANSTAKFGQPERMYPALPSRRGSRLPALRGLVKSARVSALVRSSFLMTGHAHVALDDLG